MNIASGSCTFADEVVTPTVASRVHRRGLFDINIKRKCGCESLHSFPLVPESTVLMGISSYATTEKTPSEVSLYDVFFLWPETEEYKQSKSRLAAMALGIYFKMCGKAGWN